jgi:hypothetical protein
MKTTNRIDSELELYNFINKLHMACIEIPCNVTLEIDSYIFQSEFNLLGQTWMPETLLPIKRFKYRGEKITFKNTENESR